MIMTDIYLVATNNIDTGVLLNEDSFIQTLFAGILTRNTSCWLPGSGNCSSVPVMKTKATLPGIRGTGYFSAYGTKV
jgi:hypothetical protein